MSRRDRLLLVALLLAGCGAPPAPILDDTPDLGTGPEADVGLSADVPGDEVGNMDPGIDSKHDVEGVDADPGTGMDVDPGPDHCTSVNDCGGGAACIDGIVHVYGRGSKPCDYPNPDDCTVCTFPCPNGCASNYASVGPDEDPTTLCLGGVGADGLPGATLCAGDLMRPEQAEAGEEVSTEVVPDAAEIVDAPGTLCDRMQIVDAGYSGSCKGNVGCRAYDVPTDGCACILCWDQVCLESRCQIVDPGPDATPGTTGTCEWFYDTCFPSCAPLAATDQEKCRRTCESQLTPTEDRYYLALDGCIQSNDGRCRADPNPSQCFYDACWDQEFRCFYGGQYPTCVEYHVCIGDCLQGWDGQQETLTDAMHVCTQDCADNSSHQAQVDRKHLYDCTDAACPACVANPVAADCTACFQAAVADPAKCNARAVPCGYPVAGTEPGSEPVEDVAEIANPEDAAPDAAAPEVAEEAAGDLPDGPGETGPTCGLSLPGTCSDASLSCQCCPAGGPLQHCLCSTTCKSAADCADPARPVCQQGPGAAGFCAPADFTCCWTCA